MVNDVLGPDHLRLCIILLCIILQGGLFGRGGLDDWDRGRLGNRLGCQPYGILTERRYRVSNVSQSMQTYRTVEEVLPIAAKKLSDDVERDQDV